MKKRETRAQKEERQRAALLQRITDIYSGALGKVWLSEDFATADLLSRAVPAIESVFEPGSIGFAFKPHNLHAFDTPESATLFLYEYGIRAAGTGG